MPIIYGKNSVEAYLMYAPQEVKRLFLQQGLQEKTRESFEKMAKAQHTKIETISKKDVDRFVGRDAVHQGVLAEVKQFQYLDLDGAIQKAKKQDKLPFFILLDQLQDPRNLGAILRSVDCAGGVDGVIITTHQSVEVTPSVIKTSTGAALNVPIIQVKNAVTALKQLKKAGIWICGLDMTGASHYRKTAYDLPLCLVVGGEDSGVRPVVKKETDFNVYIPMESPTVTSLNVSVATSLLAYEVAFQRSSQANNK